jgi:hypothetical protein
MRGIRGLLGAVLGAVLALCSTLAGAATFQYQVLAASSDWLVLRENLPATSADTAACRYEDLDPSDFVGVRVHFLRLSAEAQRGGAMLVASPEATVDVLSARRDGQSCTDTEEARVRWDRVAERARSFGLSLPRPAVVPQVLGRPVPAARCEVLAGGAGAPCRVVHGVRVRGGPLRIAVSLMSVPIAADEKTCQFVGHRLAAVVQVAGLDFGRIGRPAPGGVMAHSDCRAQQFQPLRLFDFGDLAVLLATVRGANIADRSERAFVMVFPTRVQP